MYKYLLFLFPLFSFSQKLTGSIKSVDGEPIVSASVILTKLKTEEIFAYDISDSSGNFSIETELIEVKFNITVRILGYKEESRVISKDETKIDFILKPELTKLEEVVVKADRITRKKDTINYRVSSFASKKDRTIADVIAKMPGIEVSANGKILYQGKPIVKYYIEGLDLLDGRYSLANNNLPYNKVSKIQILENHQPVKILDSLVFSDKAALNIKLKNNTTVTGQAEIGIGYKPALWENNITPMLFRKKEQLISSYQSNNVGKNIRSQLDVLTIDDLENGLENSSFGNDWLTIQKIRTPDFSERKWLDNNINLISVNFLKTINKEYNFRLNTSYYNDYQKQEGLKRTFLFVNRDTIFINENTSNRFYTNSIKTNLSIEKNNKNHFFNNKLIYEGFWDSKRGNILTNSSTIDQNLNSRYFSISNKLENIVSLGGKLLSLKSFLIYKETPQELDLRPGQFFDLFNNGSEFGNLNQKIDLKKFYTNNSLRFTKGIHHFTIDTKVGFEMEYQNLISKISDGNQRFLDDSFNNSLIWLRNRTFLDIRTQFKKEGWQIQFNSPVSFNYFDLSDEQVNEVKRLNKFVYEPRLSISKDLSSIWQIKGGVSIQNNFGRINNIHRAYIIKNYRSIQKISSPIPNSTIENSDLGFFYRNQLKSLFGNLSFNYSKTEDNIIYNSQITSSGNTELVAISMKNYKKTYSLLGRISKYISSVRTSVSFNVGFFNNNFQQIINGSLATIETQNNDLNLKINTDVTDWFDIDYKGFFNISENKTQGVENKPIKSQSHLIDLNFFPKRNQFIGLKSQFYNNDLFAKQGSYFFMDLVLRHTFKDKRIDFEIIYNNIFNTQNYRTIGVDNFSYIETNFQLRPSQFVIKARMSL